MKTQWTGRVVTDTRGDSGTIILSGDLTAPVLTDEADVEIAAEYLYAAAHEN